MIVIGIDPGTTTGVAVWNARERALIDVMSATILRAMSEVRQWDELSEFKPLVIFEDARTIRLGGGETYGKNARLQGVGSVKRDCAIWQEFLEDEGFPYLMKGHGRGTTKWSAEEFERITGWKKQTNSHGRDAAVMVHGLNLPMAEGIVRAWQQRSTHATGRSSRKASGSAGTRAPRSTTRAGA